MRKIILTLIFFGIFIFLQRSSQVFADAQCGSGYVCWEGNGGSAALVNKCELRSNGCYANGTYTQYCECTGGSNCSCTIGPGTTCTAGSDPNIPSQVCSCTIGGGVCDGPTGGGCQDEWGQPYATGTCNCSPSTSNGCYPTGSSTIGCCYAESVTPTPTPTPTPPGGGGGSYLFTGNVFEDANALPLGLGSSDNLCAGDTTNLVSNTGGVVGIARTGESKAQVLSGASYSIEANSNSNDYTVTLDLPFPPIDPDNPWQCSCNADPSDPYRCTYTNQQPDQGLVNFFIKQAGSTSSAWFQTLGGSSFAVNHIESKVPFASCTLPTCNPAFILRDPLGTLDSAGFPLTNAGVVVTSQTGGVYIHEADGRSNALQAQALGVAVPLEDYEYFYKKFGGSAVLLTGVTKPIVSSDNLGVFVYSGNLSIDETNPWYLGNEEQIVVFVDGNLTLNDTTGGENRLTTVATGGDGFLMFIISGNMTITSQVGYDNIYAQASAPDIANVEGVFVTDGIFTVEGVTGVTDKKFIGAGTFVGWSGVDLQRSFADGTLPNLDNNAPAESFIFRPDFIINAPRSIKSSQQTWREIAPQFSN